jgi:hypothetical protein
MQKKLRYEVIPAAAGAQALRLLTTLNVDGVLLGYDLPDVTASAIRAEMKRIKPDIPVRPTVCRHWQSNALTSIAFTRT